MHISAATLHFQVTLHTAGAGASNNFSESVENFPLAQEELVWDPRTTYSKVQEQEDFWR